MAAEAEEEHLVTLTKEAKLSLPCSMDEKGRKSLEGLAEPPHFSQG